MEKMKCYQDFHTLKHLSKDELLHEHYILLGRSHTFHKNVLQMLPATPLHIHYKQNSDFNSIRNEFQSKKA